MKLAFLFSLSFFSFFQNTKYDRMIESITEITVHNKSPKEIYDFMFTLTQEKYELWHPEHKEFKVIKSTTDTIGSVFYFNEIINGYKIDFKWEVIEIEKDKRILMKAKYFIPITLELTLKEENKNTVVKHHLKIGYNGKRAGISERIIRKYYFTDKVIKDLDRHAKEEFSNLEWLIK